MAERLRRTLKARVRKSVGSIPTDCNCVNFFLPSDLLHLLAFAASLDGWESGTTVLRAGSNLAGLVFEVVRPRIAQLAERETVDGYN